MSGLVARVRRRVHAGLEVDAALEVARGERVVLFGPSGAGKTTLLRLISGLARPGAGRIELDGVVLFDATRRIDVALPARRVGMIYQDDRLFPHLDVAANVAYGLRGWGASERADRVREVVRLCGIETLLGRRVAALSGGERQRVGLARAVAPRPRLLLCDEPVSALDAASRLTLLECLRAIQSVERFPLLYVTHSVAEAVAVGDRLLVLRAGRIVDSGPPLEVLARAGLPESAWAEPIVNAIRGEVVAIDEAAGECRVRLGGASGPEVVAPHAGARVGALCTLAVRSDEIVVARLDVASALATLSARNVVAGRVDAVVVHGGEAEVVVAAGPTRWTVSITAATVDRLGLARSVEVSLIFKARGVRWHAEDDGPE